MKMKKTLAILLSLALVICMFPGAAFATDGSGDPAPTPAAAEVTLSGTTAEYNGAVQKPSVTAVKVNNAAVTDYTVTYSEGFKDVGNYTVTVTGTIPATESTAAVTFSGTAQFSITALDINSSKVNILVPDQASGTTAVVGEKFIYNGYQTTAFANDYTVTVSGTKATFTGSGNLTGSREVTFKTVPTLASVFTATAHKTGAYDGTEKTVSVSLTAKTGYVYISPSSYDVTPKTVVNKQPYDIVITAKEGSGYAGSITLTNQDIVPARDAANYNVQIADIPNQGYTGGQIKPAVTVTDNLNGKTVALVAGRDYYVTYGPNVNIGTNSGSVTVTFQGNYVGTRTAYFDIIDPTKNVGIAYVSVSNNDARTYTGYRDEPNYVVTLGSKTLTRSSEYEVVYTNDATGVSTTSPVNAGTYTVTVRGIGYYGGEQVLGQKYVINTRSINDATVSGLLDSYAYAGVKVEPVFSVYYPYNTLLTKGTISGDGDYYVTYGANSTVGASTGVIYIHGNGNFSGTKVVRFAIAGKSISGCNAYYADGVSSSTYTGTAVKPAIAVKDGYYTTLRQGIDYTVSYKNASGKTVSTMKDAGTYTVVITGKGNYSGELNLSYTIKGKDISYYTVALNKTSAKATGTAQSVSVTSVKYGTTALKSTDYTVSYQNTQGQTVTSMSAPGTYKVVVTGKGGYFGSTYATFVITGTPQTVTLNQESSVKVYKDTDPFKVTAKATGDGTGFIYTSSNPEVATVSATGVVTVKTIGRAKITATTVGMKKSEETSASFVVKVYPDKTTISKKPWTEGKKGSLRVRWDIQEDATYYEVRYSRDKSFKKGTYKTKKVTASEKYDTQSTALKDLYSGKTYYVKVRAVKVVYNDFGEELKYYGKWSNWRSAKTK